MAVVMATDTVRAASITETDDPEEGDGRYQLDPVEKLCDYPDYC